MTLTEDVQKALDAVETSVGKEETRTYKALVSAMGTAKKDIEQTSHQWRGYRQSCIQYCQETAQQWEDHLKEFEKGEAIYAKAKQDATSRLSEIKEQIKEIHEKTTASQQEQEDMDFEVETEAEVAASQLHIKKMKEAMQGAVTTMKTTAEDYSPKRKSRDGTQIPVPR